MCRHYRHGRYNYKRMKCQEKVQRGGGATGMVKGFKKLPYETTLKKLGICSLTDGDCVEANREA